MAEQGIFGNLFPTVKRNCPEATIRLIIVTLLAVATYDSLWAFLEEVKMYKEEQFNYEEQRHSTKRAADQTYFKNILSEEEFGNTEVFNCFHMNRNMNLVAIQEMLDNRWDRDRGLKDKDLLFYPRVYFEEDHIVLQGTKIIDLIWEGLILHCVRQQNMDKLFKLGVGVTIQCAY